MAAASDYLENALINHVLRNDPMTSPSAVYVAIFDGSASAASLESGSFTGEVTDYNGDRPQANWGAPSDGVTSNTNELRFENMPATDVEFAAVVDAATGGNILYHGALNTARTVESGDAFVIQEGDFTVTKT